MIASRACPCARASAASFRSLAASRCSESLRRNPCSESLRHQMCPQPDNHAASDLTPRRAGISLLLLLLLEPAEFCSRIAPTAERSDSNPWP